MGDAFRRLRAEVKDLTVLGESHRTSIETLGTRIADEASERTRLQTSLQRQARSLYVVKLPEIAVGNPVWAKGVHNWSGSYSTGGEAPDPPIPPLPGSEENLRFPVQAGHVFEYVSGKIKVWDLSTGAEVPAATDLSLTLGSTKYERVGTASPDFVLHRFQSPGFLFGARLHVANAVAVDTSDYVTFELFRRSEGETIGVSLADPRSTATRELPAAAWSKLIELARRESFEAGQELMLRVTQFGTAPPTLTRPAVEIDVMRTVR